MKSADYYRLLIIVVSSSALMLVGLYLLAKFNSLFKRSVKNELLRKNIVVWMIAVCLVVSLSPTSPEFYGMLMKNRLATFYIFQCAGVTVEALFTFNVTWQMIRYLNRKQVGFNKRMNIILFTIIACTMLMSFPTNYLGNKYLGDGASFNNLEITVLLNFYTGCMAGLIYVTMNYVDLDRKRKMNEKELELTKLRELKTKAELD